MWKTPSFVKCSTAWWGTRCGNWSHYESNSKQTGRRAHEIHEAEVNRMQLCCNLMALTLVNDDVQCYVNTVFITVYGTHLLCSDFVIKTWGPHTVGMMQLLLDPAVAFQQWEVLRSHGPHGYGDFLSFFLGWLNTDLVAQTFQRRYSTDAGVVIAKKSSRHAPIFLHSELWSEIPGAKRFQTIVDCWTQVNGMTSALVVASKLVCFQFCRFQSMTLADRTSFDFGNLCIYLTEFTNDQVSTARIPYRVVALVQYSGDSWRGHYTCSISYSDSYGQANWLHYDDNRPPNVWREIPEGFTWNISHVWLVRADRFLEWHVPPPTPSAQDVAARDQALEQVLASLVWFFHKCPMWLWLHYFQVGVFQVDILYGSCAWLYIPYGLTLGGPYLMMWCPFCVASSNTILSSHHVAWAVFEFFSVCINSIISVKLLLQRCYKHLAFPDFLTVFDFEMMNLIFLPWNAGWMFSYFYFATSYTMMGILSTFEVVVTCLFS